MRNKIKIIAAKIILILAAIPLILYSLIESDAMRISRHPYFRITLRKRKHSRKTTRRN